MMSKTKTGMYLCMKRYKLRVVDLLQLRYFQAVARHEHVSRAAAELHVAQPALSRSIARLESELNVPLFDREGRRIRLNRFGATFLARVDQVLDHLDQGRRELEDAAGLARGSVAVASETLRTVTELSAHFIAKHPEVSFQLHQGPAPVMGDLLRTGTVDFCLASQPLEGVEVESMVLSNEEVLVAIPPTHGLARRRRLDLGMLADEPFITTRPGYWQRTLADQLFSRIGVQPRIVCEGDEPGAIRGLISAGVGVGLLPAASRRATPSPKVAWLHLDDPVPLRSLKLVWRKSAYLSVAARSFRDLAVDVARLWSNDG